MGNALFFRPPPPSYSLQTMTSPPLYYIYGVPCLWYPQKQAPGIIIYLHANATDLGQIQSVLFALSRATGYTVLGMEYPGYGVYHGSPSPQGCVRAGMKVISYLHKHARHVPLVLMGRSIGTGVAAQLCQQMFAHHQPPHALILISPFTSVAAVAGRLVDPNVANLVCGSTFDTAAVMPLLTCPTLLLHGTIDGLIPIDQSQTLLALSGAVIKKLAPLHHNDHNNLSWSTINQECATFLLGLSSV